MRRPPSVRGLHPGAWLRPWPVLAALLVWSVASPAARTGAAAQSAAPTVVVGEYDGVIHPIAAEFVADLLASAAQQEAAAVVLVLRTPGGLLESTRTIVTQMIASPVPVVVFVSPAGSRAASAGFIITIAADVAAMSPGTHIGAAHPVSAGGAQPSGEGSDVMAQKAAEDTAAYARSLAEARGRNVALSAAAVTESRAFTEREALAATPPLIDVTAADVPALLRALDGRTITRFDGRTVTLRTAGAQTVEVAPTWRQQALSAIAHPQVAYLLFTLGMLGLMVEFWNPGLVLPGVAGGLSVLLAFFAFQILPVDVAGLLLLLFGLALLGAEVLSPSFGILGIGGIVALLAGSLMITREVPGVRVSLEVILPVVGAAAVLVIGLGRLGYNAQRLRPVGGIDDLVGAPAVALTPLGPDVAGQIRVRGEIWRAMSERPLPAGQRLRVVDVAGLTARVRALDDRPPAGGPP